MFESMTSLFATLQHGSVLLGVALRGTDTKAGLLVRGAKVLAGVSAGWEGIKTSLFAIGGFLMDGLIGGLTAKLKAVKDKILSIGDSVTSWFKDKLGIASPSKVFAGLGGHLSEGLAVGIDSQKGYGTCQHGRHSP